MGLEAVERDELASKDQIDAAKLLLSSYQSVWSSGNPASVVGRYASNSLRSDTLFQEKQEGQDAIASYAKSFFAWYPGVKWNLQQSFGGW